MFRFLCVAALMAASVSAHAESGFDLETMKKVFSEVQEMPNEEAEYFTTFMAACGAAKIVDDGLPGFYCRQARLSYTMRFRRGRELDSLLGEREKAVATALTKNAATFRGAMDTVWVIDENLVDAVAARSAARRALAKESSRQAGQSKR